MASIAEKTISPKKLKTIEDIQRYIQEYSCFGLIHMKKMPSKQLQLIRKSLRDKDTVIKMAKNNIIKLAIDGSSKKGELQELKDNIEGSTALIFTKMNIFKLKGFLDKNKADAPAKAGDIATKDINIPSGNTGFPPGAVITELNKVGLKTKVQSGTIWIKEDLLAVKKGDEIDRAMALVFSRLNITPMEIGLKIYLAYDDGSLLKDEELDVDLDQEIENFKQGFAKALQLSTEIAWVTAENVNNVIQKAYNQAKNLAINVPIIEKDFIEDILMKANQDYAILASKITEVDPKALPDGLVAAPKVKKAPKKKKAAKKGKKKEKVEEEPVGLGNLFG